LVKKQFARIARRLWRAMSFMPRRALLPFFIDGGGRYPVKLQ